MKQALLAVLVWLVPTVVLAAPAVTLTTSSAQYSQKAHVVATFSDEVAGFDPSTLQLSPSDLMVSNFAQDSTSTYSFDVAPSGGNPDATIVVPAGVATSTATSTDGNDQSNTLSFSFFTEHPHVSVSADSVASQQALPAYTNAPVTVYATFNTSFPITDFTLAGVAVTNATTSDLQAVGTAGTEYSFVVTPSAEGTTTVAVSAGASGLGAGSIASDNTLSTTYDTTAPTLALVGGATTTVELGSTYSDAGAIAQDAIEGDISGRVSVSGSVDTSTLGDYTLTYSVSDSAGNAATSTSRVVEVVKKSQTITLAAIGDRLVGSSPFDVSATTTSGLSLTYAAAGACTLATTTLTLTGLGSCTVVVAQAGDATYAEASTSQTFSINPASSGGGGGGGGGSNGPSTPVSTGSSAATAFHAIIPSVPDSTSATQFSQPASTGGQVLGAQTYKFSTYLVRGSEGEAVTNLQKLLIALGLLPEGSAVGHFGPLTQAAVAAYQKAHNITQTGTVGPITRAALNRETITF